MIDDAINKIRVFLTRNKDELKDWMSLVGDMAKLSAIFAGPVGLCILISYLQSVRAPLPIADFSTAPALIIIAAVYSFIVAFITAGVFGPALFSSVPWRIRRHIRIRHFDYSLRGRRFKEHLGSQPILFQSSAYLTILVYCVLRMSRASFGTSALWLVGATFVGGAVSVGSFYRSGVTPTRTRHFKRKLCSNLFFGALARGGLCVAWLRLLATLLLAFPVIHTGQRSAPVRTVTWLLFFIGTAAIYARLTSVKARLERFPLLIILSLCLGLPLYPNFFSKRTLHFLGIGGGIPIELLLKTMDPQGTTIVARLVHGCLILNAGSRVIIQPMSAPTVDTCSRGLLTGETGYDTMYKGIEVFSGADILKMKGVTYAQTTAHRS